jgi:hypothetical protein
MPASRADTPVGCVARPVSSLMSTGPSSDRVACRVYVAGDHHRDVRRTLVCIPGFVIEDIFSGNAVPSCACGENSCVVEPERCASGESFFVIAQ